RLVDEVRSDPLRIVPAKVVVAAAAAGDDGCTLSGLGAQKDLRGLDEVGVVAAAQAAIRGDHDELGRLGCARLQEGMGSVARARGDAREQLVQPRPVRACLFRSVLRTEAMRLRVCFRFGTARYAPKTPLNSFNTAVSFALTSSFSSFFSRISLNRSWCERSRK